MSTSTHRTGMRLGSFDLEERLGEGGMGVVFRARDRRLSRDVAIKLLREDVAGDETRRERFQREARAASALNHPNIVTIHEIDDVEGTLYLVMELVAGRTFRTLVDSGPTPVDELVLLAGQVIDGLSKAHAAGIVHRDLKPENLMVTDDGLVKILDFGLAKLLPARRAGDEEMPTAERNLTEPDVVVGTVGYMSPEQISGRTVDARSDQFALGTILYEMASGRHPFRRGSKLETLSAILEAKPTPVEEERPELPAHLTRAIGRTLSKDAGERYPSVGELRLALDGRDLGSPESAPVFPSFLRAHDEEEEKERQTLVVGREQELDRLGGLLEESISHGGRPVFVVGDAGTGKTMLLREFAERAQRRHETLVVASGNCDAQTGIGDPYLPFREILALLSGDVESRRVAGALPLRQARMLWNLFPEVLQTLLSTGPDLIDTFVTADALMARAVHFPATGPSIGRLRQLTDRGGGAGLQQSAVLEQFTQVLLELSRRHPLLLLIEDLHWADEGTVGLLFHLSRRLQGVPILLIATYRPAQLTASAERHPVASAVQELQAQLGELEIVLGSEGGREFLEAVVDSRPNRLDSAFRDALFRQTQGHPLFTVELLEELSDRDVITEDNDGLRVLSGPVDWEKLPARVEAVIAERLARLPDRLRRLLKLGSIEGEEFTAEAVARAEGADEREVIRALSEELDKRHRLVSALGIRRAGAQRLSIYRFRHILFQKYLYQQVDEVERSYLHEAIGVELERLLGGKAADSAVQLARHFREAGLSAKAIDHLQQAGAKAVRLGANDQAAEHYSEALRLLETVPAAPERDTREVELRLGLGMAFTAVRGFASPEAEVAFGRAEELILKGAASSRLFAAQWNLWTAHCVSGNFGTSTPLAARLLKTAEDEEDDGLLLQALHATNTDAFFRGELREAWADNERARRLYRHESHHAQTFEYGNHDVGACCLNFGALTLALMGESGRAVAMTEESVRLSELLEHPMTLLQTLSFRAAVFQFHGSTADALEAAEKALEPGLGSVSPQFYGIAQATRGWALARLGRLSEAVAPLETATASLSRSGMAVMDLFAALTTVELNLAAGELSRTEHGLDRVGVLRDKMGTHFLAAEVARLEGEYLVAVERLDDAEARFVEAANVARDQSAHALVLRAAMSRARLREREGRMQEVSELLAPAIAAIPDGSENHYVSEARILAAR